MNSVRETDVMHNEEYNLRLSSVCIENIDDKGLILQREYTRAEDITSVLEEYNRTGEYQHKTWGKCAVINVIYRGDSYAQSEKLSTGEYDRLNRPSTIKSNISRRITAG